MNIIVGQEHLTSRMADKMLHEVDDALPYPFMYHAHNGMVENDEVVVRMAKECVVSTGQMLSVNQHPRIRPVFGFRVV